MDVAGQRERRVPVRRRRHGDVPRRVDVRKRALAVEIVGEVEQAITHRVQEGERRAVEFVLLEGCVGILETLFLTVLGHDRVCRAVELRVREEVSDRANGTLEIVRRCRTAGRELRTRRLPRGLVAGGIGRRTVRADNAGRVVRTRREVLRVLALLNPVDDLGFDRADVRANEQRVVAERRAQLRVEELLVVVDERTGIPRIAGDRLADQRKVGGIRALLRARETADDRRRAVVRAPRGALRREVAPCAHEPDLERGLRGEIVAQLEDFAARQERTARIAAILDDPEITRLIRGRCINVAVLRLVVGSVQPAGTDVDDVRQLADGAGREQIRVLREIVVRADVELGRRLRGVAGGEQVDRAADGDVGERRRVAGAGLRLGSAQQIRRKILAGPGAVLAECERMAVDEHLRFVRLCAADDDVGVRIVAHVLQRHVGQALEHVVDLRCGLIRELLRAQEGRRCGARVDRTPARSRGGTHRADRAQRRQIDRRERNGERRRRTGDHRQVGQRCRIETGLAHRDAVDARWNRHAEGAVPIRDDRRRHRAADRDRSTGNRRARAAANRPRDHGRRTRRRRGLRGRRRRDGNDRGEQRGHETTGIREAATDHNNLFHP